MISLNFVFLKEQTIQTFEILKESSDSPCTTTTPPNLNLFFYEVHQPCKGSCVTTVKIFCVEHDLRFSHNNTTA